ncbi:MAG: serine protease DegS [Planctomycetaceae bacterium]|nr:serine protease DegS [Planctomycetaceae bacterium]
MKWIRSFVPASLFALGIASTAALGIAFAQDQDEKPAQNKNNATQNQKNGSAAKDASKNAADRSAADKNSDEKTPAENQRAAALGAQFEAKGDQGISASTVDQNGMLGHAGLKQNDRIISADGRNFSNSRQFEAYLWAQSGRTVPVIIERGGKQYTIQALIPQHGTNSGWLGVFLDEGDPNTPGARIAQIYPSGPAARSGLHLGDVIKQIDDQQIAGSADAVMLIREFQPQAQVNFTIERGKEEMKIPVTIGSRRDFQQNFQGGPQSARYQSSYQGQGQGQQQGQQAQGQDNEDFNQFNGVPPHAMQLESERRNFEQHERIEDEIRQLREEIKQLRALLEKK